MHKIKTKLYKNYLICANKQIQSALVYPLSLIIAACSGYLEVLIILKKTQNRGTQVAVIYAGLCLTVRETTVSGHL